MNSKIKSEAADNLFRCILTMNNLEECYKLFEDLCTVHEIQAIAQRMQVAEMLDRKCTYIEIAEKTGASTATISLSLIHIYSAISGIVFPIPFVYCCVTIIGIPSSFKPAR